MNGYYHLLQRDLSNPNGFTKLGLSNSRPEVNRLFISVEVLAYNVKLGWPGGSAEWRQVTK
jgi:hypothetical protein